MKPLLRFAVRLLPMVLLMGGCVHPAGRAGEGAPSEPAPAAGGILSQPKYSGIDHQTQWARTPEAERPVARRISLEASDLGWEVLRAGDEETAMRRFNQAWTLCEENPEALWGMGIVQVERAKALGVVRTGEEVAQMRTLLDSAVSLVDEAITLGEPDPDPSLLHDAALQRINRGSLRRSGGDEGGTSDFDAADSLLSRAEAVSDHPKLAEVRRTLEAARAGG